MSNVYDQVLAWYNNNDGISDRRSNAEPVTPFNDEVRKKLRSAFHGGESSTSGSHSVNETANSGTTAAWWRKCDQCNMRFLSRKNYDQHRAGMLHKQRLLQLKRLSDAKRGDLPETDMDSRKTAIVKKWRIAEREKLSSLSRKREENRRQQQTEGGVGIIPDRFYCTLCDLTMRPAQKDDHVASDAHCQNFVREQVTMGFEAFKMKYGNVIFGKKGPDLRLLPDGLPETLLVYRSGVINLLECTACGIKCFTMDSWVRHVESEGHEKKFISLKETSEEAYNALCSRIPTHYRSMKTKQDQEAAEQAEKVEKAKEKAIADASSAAKAAEVVIKARQEVREALSNRVYVTPNQSQDKSNAKKRVSRFSDITESSVKSGAKVTRQSGSRPITGHSPGTGSGRSRNNDRNPQGVRGLTQGRGDKSSQSNNRGNRSSDSNRRSNLNTDRNRRASRPDRRSYAVRKRAFVNRHSNRGGEGSLQSNRSGHVDESSDMEIIEIDSDNGSCTNGPPASQTAANKDKHSDLYDPFDKKNPSVGGGLVEKASGLYDPFESNVIKSEADTNKVVDQTRLPVRQSRFDKVTSSNLATTINQTGLSVRQSHFDQVNPAKLTIPRDQSQPAVRQSRFDQVKPSQSTTPFDQRNFPNGQSHKINASNVRTPFDQTVRQSRFDQVNPSGLATPIAQSNLPVGQGIFDQVNPSDMATAIGQSNRLFRKLEGHFDKNNPFRGTSFSGMFNPFSKHRASRESSFNRSASHFAMNRQSHRGNRFEKNSWLPEAQFNSVRYMPATAPMTLAPCFEDTDMRDSLLSTPASSRVVQAIQQVQQSWKQDSSTGSDAQHGRQQSSAGSNRIEETAVCKLCDVYLPAEYKDAHDSDIRHCEKYLCKQITLGFETFNKYYSDVPFGFTEPKYGEAPADATPFVMLVYRSGMVTDMVCNVCRFEANSMSEWYTHLMSYVHLEECFTLMTDVGVREYLQQNGPVPFIRETQTRSEAQQAQSMDSRYSTDMPAATHVRGQDFSHNPQMGGGGGGGESMRRDSRSNFPSYPADHSLQRSTPSAGGRPLVEMNDLPHPMSSSGDVNRSMVNTNLPPDTNQHSMSEAWRVLQRMDPDAVDMLGQLPHDEMLRMLQRYINRQTDEFSFQ